MFATAEQAILQSVAQQLIDSGEVELETQRLQVKRVGGERLRMVRFEMNGREYDAIEQSQKKSSRWAQLARENHRIVQFREVRTNKYVAVSVDGRLTEYGRH
jgi:hypothetical protein